MSIRTRLAVGIPFFALMFFFLCLRAYLGESRLSTTVAVAGTPSGKMAAPSSRLSQRIRPRPASCA